MLKKGSVLMILILTVLCAQPPRAAAFDSPYDGYTYDFYGRPVPSPTVYSTDRVLYGEDIGTSPLKSGEDLFVYNDEIYIADSGNDRIVVLDSKYKLKKIYSVFYNQDKSESRLKNPKGIDIRDGRLLIADTGNARVIQADMDGNILLTLGVPGSELIPKNFIFTPVKCLSDRAGNFYVLSEGIYQGLINYDAGGAFIGFYGGNKVQVDFQMMIDRFWKKILNQKQQEGLSSNLATEYSSIYLTGDFIYATTKQTVNSLDEVRKLNSMGVNILHYSPRAASYPLNNFGDVEGMYDTGSRVDNAFIDVHVDEDEIISLLDRQRGRVFLYDQDCKLLGVFGAIGEQKGTTRLASAIEKFGGDYVVLDKEKNCLILYRETQYMKLMRQGIRYYSQGLYDEAIEPWRKVLVYNSACPAAYQSIGKSLLQKNEYKDAMDYFKRAQARDDYSRAQKEYRKLFVRRHFLSLAIGAALFLFLFSRLIRLILKWIGVKRAKRKIIYQ